MDTTLKRSPFGVWFDALKGSKQQFIRETIIEESGVSNQTVNNYLSGKSDVVKNLPPVVKKMIVASFPDAENHLFSPVKND